MVLILGALHIDLDRTQGILQPDKTATQLQLWSQSCTAGLRSLEIDNHEVMQGLLHWERSLSTDSNLRSPRHTRCGRVSATLSGSRLRCGSRT